MAPDAFFLSFEMDARIHAFLFPHQKSICLFRRNAFQRELNEHHRPLTQPVLEAMSPAIIAFNRKNINGLMNVPEFHYGFLHAEAHKFCQRLVTVVEGPAKAPLVILLEPYHPDSCSTGEIKDINYAQTTQPSEHSIFKAAFPGGSN